MQQLTASDVISCILKGVYIQQTDENKDYLIIEMKVVNVMKLGGYHDCGNMIGEIRKLNLDKLSLIPKNRKLVVGEIFTVNYHHLSDKGGVHYDAAKYVEWHNEKNH